jgi:hypothetical protein
MPVIDHIDAPNRDIYLHADTVGADLEPVDIYREMRALRRSDETLRPYDVFLTAKGYDQKGPGKYTERYVVCNLGTRIIPYDTSHTLTVIGTIITDDGQEGVACFDRSPLSPTTIVDINYQPPQVEVIEVNTGSGVSPQDIADIRDAVWQHLVESAFSAEQLMRVMGAALAGKVSGAGTSTVVFRDIEDSKPVITATVDENGNRLAITVDAT